jgi:hypothetical protein
MQQQPGLVGKPIFEKLSTICVSDFFLLLSSEELDFPGSIMIHSPVHSIKDDRRKYRSKCKKSIFDLISTVGA